MTITKWQCNDICVLCTYLEDHFYSTFSALEHQLLKIHCLHSLTNIVCVHMSLMVIGIV